MMLMGRVSCRGWGGHKHRRVCKTQCNLLLDVPSATRGIAVTIMASLRQRAPVEIAPDPSSGSTFQNVQQPRQQQSQKQIVNVVSSLIMFLWLGSVVLGCQLYDGTCTAVVDPPLPAHTGTRPKRHSPMLAAYDLLFRSVGALLPFCILIPRAVGIFILEGRAFPQTSLHKNLMYIYMGMTVLRAVVYNVVLVGTLPPPNLPWRAFEHNHRPSSQPRAAAKRRGRLWSRRLGTNSCLTTFSWHRVLSPS